MDMAQFLIAIVTAIGFALEGAAALLRASICWRRRRAFEAVRR